MACHNSHLNLHWGFFFANHQDYYCKCCSRETLTHSTLCRDNLLYLHFELEIFFVAIDLCRSCSWTCQTVKHCTPGHDAVMAGRGCREKWRIAAQFTADCTNNCQNYRTIHWSQKNCASDCSLTVLIKAQSFNRNYFVSSKSVTLNSYFINKNASYQYWIRPDSEFAPVSLSNSHGHVNATSKRHFRANFHPSPS